MEQLTLLAVGVGATAVIAGVQYVVEKRRTEAVAAWATSRSLTFEPARPSLVDEYERFKLFKAGHTRRVLNVVEGRRDGLALRVVDYQYKTGAGRDKRTHKQTVCILDGEARHEVHFFCRRQSVVFDAIGKLFGGQDVNFDDDPAFSKAFVLQTDGEESRLRTFLGPRLRALLVELAPRNIALEVAGGTQVLHMGRRVKPEELDDLVAVALRIRRACG